MSRRQGRLFVAMNEERVSSWRWGLYIVCTVDAIFVPLVGGVVKGAVGDIALLILYIIWAALLSLFGATFFARSSAFIIQCLYYLSCSALPLAFFGSFAGASLNLWLPVSSCLGIFVGVGLRDCCSQITTHIRRTLRRKLFRWLDANDPLLPRYRSRTVHSLATIDAGLVSRRTSPSPTLNRTDSLGTILTTFSTTSLNDRDRYHSESSGHVDQNNDIQPTSTHVDSPTINPWADN